VQGHASTRRWIASDPPRVVWVVLEGGTLTSSAAGVLPAPSTAPLWGCVERGGGGSGVVGTLLGPEGAGDLLSLAQGRPWSHIAGSLWGVRVGWGLLGWWLFVG
jgi:hypothetical protein